TAAAGVASALGVSRMLFVTDVPGILHDGELVKFTSPEHIQSLVENGVIYGGMIPKVRAAEACLQSGVSEVAIVSGHRSFYDDEGLYGTTIQGA
ncbi:MAG: acetylglutamate kinase, partial [Bacilli bacterium]